MTAAAVMANPYMFLSGLNSFVTGLSVGRSAAAEAAALRNALASQLNNSTVIQPSNSTVVQPSNSTVTQPSNSTSLQLSFTNQNIAEDSLRFLSDINFEDFQSSQSNQSNENDYSKYEDSFRRLEYAHISYFGVAIFLSFAALRHFHSKTKEGVAEMVMNRMTIEGARKFIGDLQNLYEEEPITTTDESATTTEFRGLLEVQNKRFVLKESLLPSFNRLMDTKLERALDKKIDKTEDTIIEAEFMNKVGEGEKILKKILNESWHGFDH
jgi:hypothetical protein